MKLADTQDLGSCVVRRAGSSPVIRIIYSFILVRIGVFTMSDRYIENNFIAYKIYDIEHSDIEIDSRQKGFTIRDNLFLQLSNDCMVWYIFKTTEARRYVKVVPAANFDENIIIKILRAQPWVC